MPVPLGMRSQRADRRAREPPQPDRVPQAPVVSPVLVVEWRVTVWATCLRAVEPKPAASGVALVAEQRAPVVAKRREMAARRAAASGEALVRA